MRTHMENTSSHLMGSILKRSPFLPSVSLKTENSWQAIGEFATKASLMAVEVLLRTPHAEKGIFQLKEKFPDLKVGLGTVLSLDEFKRAEDCGADFVVSPGMTKELLDRAEEMEVAYLPGVMTPSEIQLLSSRGFWNAKLFPAGFLGEAYLKTLEGPYPHMRFCVAGAISEDTWSFFAQCVQVRSISGTWIMPQDALDETQTRAWIEKLETRHFQFSKFQSLI
ncbi:MAG: bifunctional 4-hydroxy-2-oxoglutarate aldolase/2-dehydro-3-deoxy-phosphogluconate aldolase [Proteobacteria bacterium]|nr:MAG: bifunctional 4-hydroxy-2-oxoglutarate aldolase/2-dehydro-3-deoxy-phosphogluconate aldolase [Pseudomonadota bacterium]